MAAAAAALGWLLVESMRTGKPTLLGAASGAVAGLVAITPASGFVDAGGALSIGFAAGFVCYFSAVWVKTWVGYDDALDAWGVHGVGGALGALLTGVFAKSAINPLSKGWIHDGNGHQLLIQFASVIATFFYCGIITFIILKLIDITIGLRVSREVEIEGLDINLHGETVHS